jgi:large repetitive protein
MKRWISAIGGLVMLISVAEAQPPQLSSLRLLPGDLAIAPTAGTQEQPAIAEGGGQYLVVWTDARDALIPLVAFWGGPYLTPGVGTMRDIYAARLDANGNLKDSTPIPVSMGTLNQGFPSVAWNGENWLVVWEHQSGLACCPTSDIYAARVSPAGAVLDASPIAIDVAEGQNLGWPRAGSDGANWLVVWQDWDVPAGIATLDGARVSPAGVVLDPGGVRLRRDSWNSYPTDAKLAFASGEYLLTWLEGAGNLENEHWVKGQRFTSSLSKIDANPFTIDLYSPTDARAPSVATDGTDFFVSWFEARYDGWAQIYGTRVSHAGVVRDPSGIAITGYAGYSQFAPVVAWSGSNWIVAYNIEPSGTLDEDLYVTRVSSAGSVLDPAGRAVRAGVGSQNSAAIAPSVSGARIVWMDTRAGGRSPEDVYSAPVSAQGVVGAEACLSIGPPAQVAPDFVWNGSQFLAVFESIVSGTVRIVGQRFDATGSALDPEPFVVASGPNLTPPAVAWDGSRYLVVWSDAIQSTVYGRRLGPAGTPIDAAPRVLMPGDAPDVAALGGVFLIVGTYAQNPHFRYPRAMRLRGSDAAILDPTPVVIGSYFATHVSAGTFGNRWLVAWQRNPTHDNPRADIVANFVDPSGVPGSEFALTATPIPSEEDPTVAVGADAALVAWTDNAGLSTSNIAARRILADGTLVGSSFFISQADNAQLEPTACWNGSEYLVGFSDSRNDPANGQPVGDIFAARVSGAGSLLDPDGFSVASGLAVPEMEPTAAGGEGIAAVGGVVFRPESPYAVYRVGYRVAPSAPLSVDQPPIARAGIVIAPNPSREDVELSSWNGVGGPIAAAIYDMAGRVVSRLTPSGTGPGRVRFAWNGRDASGNAVAPGIYLVRVRSAAGNSIARLVRSR